MARWAPKVDGPGGRAHPDRILISDRSDEWCVVEVEIASHPASHFDSQFHALGLASYGLHLAESVVRSCPWLDLQGARALLANEPTLVCIVDCWTEAVRDACRENGFELLVLEPYRSSSTGSFALRRGRVPPVLRLERRLPGAYALPYSTSLGGSAVLSVPSTFPHADSIMIRRDDELYECSIKQRSDGSRLTIFPAELGVTVEGVRLKPIDPVMRIYRIDR
jgi:hypothetical protein